VKEMASQEIGWLKMSDYIGSTREMGEWTSVPIGLLWD
jgi:hypothetical protein